MVAADRRAYLIIQGRRGVCFRRDRRSSHDDTIYCYDRTGACTHCKALKVCVMNFCVGGSHILGVSLGEMPFYNRTSRLQQVSTQQT